MSTSEEIIDIDTPENVAFGYQVAGLGSRFIATLLDTLIIIFLQVLIVLVRILVLYMVDASTLNEDAAFSGWIVALFGLIAFVFYSGYYVLFEMLWNGQSPGKRVAGIRVIRTDGTPITLSGSLIRNLARLVDFLPFMYGVGVITMFLDKQSRRLGDLAANTLVVHDRAPISIQSLSAKEAVIPMQGRRLVPLDGFPFERLTNDDLSLIEDFMKRYEQLMNRDLLARQILSALYTRLGLPLPSITQAEVEDTLRTILYTVQRRQADEYWRNRDNERTK